MKFIILFFTLIIIQCQSKLLLEEGMYSNGKTYYYIYQHEEYENVIEIRTSRYKNVEYQLIEKNNVYELYNNKNKLIAKLVISNQTETSIHAHDRYYELTIENNTITLMKKKDRSIVFKLNKEKDSNTFNIIFISVFIVAILFYIYLMKDSAKLLLAGSVPQVFNKKNE